MTDKERSITLTDINNFLYHWLGEECYTLVFSLQPGCLCGRCYEFQIIDDDGKIVKSWESSKELTKLIEEQCRHDR